MKEEKRNTEKVIYRNSTRQNALKLFGISIEMSEILKMEFSRKSLQVERELQYKMQKEEENQRR